MKPRSWATHRIPEHHPDTWAELPGYDEAAEKVRQGQSLFPVAPSPVTAQRVRRTVESLTAERDRLTAQRDALYGHHLPDDPGALSGIRRKRTTTDTKRDAATDRNLERAAKLTTRIDYLDMRIRKEEARNHHGGGLHTYPPTTHERRVR